MKIKNLFLLLISLGVFSNQLLIAQNIDIPDTNFKKYLVENFDIDKDGEISRKEALIVTSLDCFLAKYTKSGRCAIFH